MLKMLLMGAQYVQNEVQYAQPLVPLGLKNFVQKASVLQVNTTLNTTPNTTIF